MEIAPPTAKIDRVPTADDRAFLAFRVGPGHDRGEEWIPYNAGSVPRVGTASAVPGRLATGNSGRSQGARTAARAGGRGRSATVEIVVGAILILVTVAVGSHWADRSAPNRVDRWVFDRIGDSHSRLLTWVTYLRYPAVIIAGAFIVAALTVRRDRIRAAACLIGPVLALATSELLVKPAVGRTFDGLFSYPSGSTVGAAALAAAVVIATPARWRPVAVVVASAYALWMTVAVIALRWHYPTDALAGLAYGVGTVLVVDGAIWWLAGRLGNWTTERRLRTPGPGTDPPPPEPTT
jgi:membrane-associated phospholipid phosphatase